jgi:hypothetical protein
MCTTYRHDLNDAQHLTINEHGILVPVPIFKKQLVEFIRLFNVHTTQQEPSDVLIVLVRSMEWLKGPFYKNISGPLERRFFIGGRVRC